MGPHFEMVALNFFERKVFDAFLSGQPLNGQELLQKLNLEQYPANNQLSNSLSLFQKTYELLVRTSGKGPDLRWQISETGKAYLKWVSGHGSQIAGVPKKLGPDRVESKEIKLTTRRNILDSFLITRIPWYGKLSQEDFLARL